MEHDDQQVTEKLAEYARRVRASPHNLLSKRGLEELETRHIPECVRFAERLPGGIELVDIGSGGGLPAMVIGIVRPDIMVTMIEATNKKANFLAETGGALGLKGVVMGGRAEECVEMAVGLTDRGGYDVVTARAVAPLERLIPICVPYLAPNGRIHALKGGRWQQEVTDAESVMRRLGVRVIRDPSQDPELDPKVVVIGR